MNKKVEKIEDNNKKVEEKNLKKPQKKKIKQKKNYFFRDCFC